MHVFQLQMQVPTQIHVWELTAMESTTQQAETNC